MKRETISQALNRLDDRHVTDTVSFSPGAIQSSPERIVQMRKKRIITFALAAVLMLALGITAYAAWGVPRWTATHKMENTGEYTSLASASAIEKITGYPCFLVEQFSNGFSFKKLNVDGEAVYDENNRMLKEYYAVHAVYSSAQGAEMLLLLTPVLDLPDQPASPDPSSVLRVGKTEVKIYWDHYKFVPEDYEKTAADLAAEEAGHFYISFGADKIEERDIASADVVIDDVIYTLFFSDASDCSDDMLIQMAAELVEAAAA